MNDIDGAVFEEPWQARAFAIAVALHERGVYDWSEWTEMLGARIATADAPGDGDAGSYYRNWLNALEAMLVEKGVTTAGETARWREAWRRAATRTAHGTPTEVQSEDF
ncbi:MAG: nitrile hydratase accessory protein [Mycobacterium sp.]|nr:nitrile hydratase accessory protein [Mycobacterium sp.]